MLSFTQYPTFVVFLAVFLGAIVTMALMPVFIKFLRSHLIGQQVRADGPESHLVKQGTPTMGGIIMLIAATVVVAVLAEPVPETWLIMAAVLATGALGLFDDASKVAHERSLGLTPKAKLIGQFFISTAFVLAAVNWLGVPPTVDIPFVCTLDFGVLTTTLPIQVPAGGEFAIPWIYLIFADILLMGMSNATNLTDGLDGLLGGHHHGCDGGNGRPSRSALACSMPPSYRRQLPAAALVSCGLTRIPPTYSWAIRVLSPWERRLAAWQLFPRRRFSR